MSFEIGLKFHPHHKNPARLYGHGVYRVVSCQYTPPVDPLIRVLRGGEFLGEELPTLLFLRTERRYKVRSRVDPRRVLGV
jgi:hypothetical protein